jgi:hypothetical protein
LDEAYVLGWGEKRPILVAVDLGTGQPVAIGYVNEHSPQAVRRWVGMAYYELKKKISKDWLWVLDEVKIIMTDLPPDGQKRLFKLWKRIPVRRKSSGKLTPLVELRYLLIRLSESWDRYTTFFDDPGIPWRTMPPNKSLAG